LCVVGQSCVFVVSLFLASLDSRPLPSFPTRRSSDLRRVPVSQRCDEIATGCDRVDAPLHRETVTPCDHDQAHDEAGHQPDRSRRSEEHTSELQSPCNLVCRLLLEKKKQTSRYARTLT